VQDNLAKMETKARDFAARGRYADAARTLTPAIHAPPQVGQYYAAQVARWYLQAGRPDAALDACELGLSLGGTASQDLLQVYQQAILATSIPEATKPAEAAQ
jgi:hypothetical protein